MYDIMTSASWDIHDTYNHNAERPDDLAQRQVQSEGPPWQTKQIITLGIFKNEEYGGFLKWELNYRFSIINHLFWGTPIYGNPHMMQTRCKNTKVMSSAKTAKNAFGAF